MTALHGNSPIIAMFPLLRLQLDRCQISATSGRPVPKERAINPRLVRGVQVERRARQVSVSSGTAH